MRQPKEPILLQQYAYACVQQSHFVGVRKFMTHGEICLFVERKNSIFHTHHPSLTTWQGFCNQTCVQQGLENCERLKTHLNAF